ncbi:MAG: hypothetical protein KDL31_06830 [Kiritimatiellae bacterium]|nr:hypothetical protein [Kiritimatiellia bacterium]
MNDWPDLTRAWIPLVLCLILTAGCATRYPMGLSREQWEALSPADQAEYQARQHELDEAARLEAAAQRRERERLAAEAERAERERLARLYAEARYGDIIQVTVQGGILEINGDRYPYHPFSFELARGEVKEVDVSTRGERNYRVSFDVRLSEDGLTFTFDDSGRDQVVLVNDGWERGKRYTVQSPTRKSGWQLSGATFSIRLRDLPGGPERVVIERR